MVTPDAFVTEGGFCFAASLGADDGAVAIDEGFFKKVFVLPAVPFPDALPTVVDDVHELMNVLLLKSPQEVAAGGGIGYALGSEGVEIGCVVAQQLDVFKSLSTTQNVVGEIEHVIALVVGQVALEQVEVVIDTADQTALACKLVYDSNTTAVHRAGFPGQFVVHVAALDDGAVVTSGCRGPLKAFFNCALALAAFLSVFSLHSKCLVGIAFLFSHLDQIP